VLPPKNYVITATATVQKSLRIDKLLISQSVPHSAIVYNRENLISSLKKVYVYDMHRKDHSITTFMLPLLSSSS